MRSLKEVTDLRKQLESKELDDYGQGVLDCLLWIEKIKDYSVFPDKYEIKELKYTLKKVQAPNSKEYMYFMEDPWNAGKYFVSKTRPAKDPKKWWVRRLKSEIPEKDIIKGQNYFRIMPQTEQTNPLELPKAPVDWDISKYLFENFPKYFTSLKSAERYLDKVFVVDYSTKIGIHSKDLPEFIEQINKTIPRGDKPVSRASLIPWLEKNGVTEYNKRRLDCHTASYELMLKINDKTKFAIATQGMDIPYYKED